MFPLRALAQTRCVLRQVVSPFMSKGAHGIDPHAASVVADPAAAVPPNVQDARQRVEFLAYDPDRDHPDMTTFALDRD